MISIGFFEKLIIKIRNTKRNHIFLRVIRAKQTTNYSKGRSYSLHLHLRKVDKTYTNPTPENRRIKYLPAWRFWTVQKSIEIKSYSKF